MINYFNENTIFSTDCAVNYRLSLLTQSNKFYKITHLYYIDGKVCLYKTPKELIEIFSENIIQQQSDITLLNEDNLVESVSKKLYIMGLYDTYKCKKNDFYNKVHNYNTFLIYGKNKDGFLTYYNSGKRGSVSAIFTANELKTFFCNDIELTEQPSINKVLGLPLSTLAVNEDNNFFNIKRIYDYFHSFYFNNTDYENFNIINYWIETGLTDLSHAYSGIQYKNVANFKLLKDMFIYHTNLLQDTMPKLFENNKSAIKIMDIIISLYGKFIYTNNKIYYERILYNLNELNMIIKRNKGEIIKYEKNNAIIL